LVNRRPRLNGSTGSDVWAALRSAAALRVVAEEQGHLEPGCRVFAGEREDADEEFRVVVEEGERVL